MNSEPDNAECLREMAAQRDAGLHPILCAWCPPDMPTACGWSTVSGSHGICRQCNERARADMGLPPR